jgi:hypothetical protein
MVRMDLGPLSFGGKSRHDAVSGCPHQYDVVCFWLLAQPREVLGSFEPPPARPAVGSTVTIERSDEVDEQFWHRRFLSLILT